MTDSTRSPKHIIDAAFALAAQQGTWRGLSLQDIADAAQIDLATLHQHFRDKADIPRAFANGLDRELLQDIDPEDSAEPVRDRLFDLFIRRFDLLESHHATIKIIARELGGGSPFDALCETAQLFRSMTWSLEASGVSTAGFVGLARVKVMTALYLSVAKTWLESDDDRMSKTEAALDKAIKRAESLQQSLPIWLKSTGGNTNNCVTKPSLNQEPSENPNAS